MSACPLPVETDTTKRSMMIYSRLLGDLTVSEDSIVTFTHGLLGFPLYQRFALVRTDDETYWLQSVDDRSLALLLIDPFVYFPNYEIDLASDTTAGLGITRPSDALVLAVATLTGPESATANLRGPIVFNLGTRKAMQVVTSAPSEIRARFQLRSALVV